jgi:YVTN family beta-propeller protein
VAVSPESGDAYVTNGASDSVSVIDPNSDTVVATIPVGNDPEGVAVSPAGPEAGDIYVTNFDDGTVSVIDPNTDTVIDTVTVGTDPNAVAVSSESADVYVTNGGSDSVSVIDPNTDTVIDTVTVGTDPNGVAISSAGPEAGDIYVTNNGDDTVSVIAGSWSDADGFPSNGNHIADWLFDGQNPSDATYDQNWYLDAIPNYESDPGGVLRDAVLTSLDGAGIADHLNGFPDSGLNTALAGVELYSTASDLQSHFGGMVDGNFVDYLHTIIEAPQFVFTAAGALGTQAAVADPALEPVAFLSGVAATGLGGLDGLLTGLAGY